MKKCEYCGGELHDDAKFCEYCGGEVSAPKSDDADLTGEETPRAIEGDYSFLGLEENTFTPNVLEEEYIPPSSEQYTASLPEEKRSRKKTSSGKGFPKMVGIGGIGLLVLVLLIGFFSCNKKEDSPFVGKWQAKTMDIYGDSYDIEDVLPGGITMEFKFDGTGLLEAPGMEDEEDEEVDDSFSWKKDGDGILISGLDLYATAYLDGDTLILEEMFGEDSTVHLVRHDGSAPVAKEEEKKETEDLGPLGAWVATGIVYEGESFEIGDVYPQVYYMEFTPDGKGQVIIPDMLEEVGA